MDDLGKPRSYKNNLGMDRIASASSGKDACKLTGYCTGFYSKGSKSRGAPARTVIKKVLVCSLKLRKSNFERSILVLVIRNTMVKLVRCVHKIL